MQKYKIGNSAHQNEKVVPPFFEAKSVGITRPIEHISHFPFAMSLSYNTLCIVRRFFICTALLGEINKV